MKHLIMILPLAALEPLAKRLGNVMRRDRLLTSDDLYRAYAEHVSYLAEHDPDDHVSRELKVRYSSASCDRPDAIYELVRTEYNPRKPRIMVEVSGGVVQQVVSDQPVEVWVKDWDNIKAGDQFDPTSPDYVAGSAPEETLNFDVLLRAELKPAQIVGYVPPEPVQPFRHLGTYWLRLRRVPDPSAYPTGYLVTANGPWSHWCQAEFYDDQDGGEFTSLNSSTNISAKGAEVLAHPELYEVRYIPTPEEQDAPETSQ